MKLLGLDTPSDDIYEVLIKGSIHLNHYREVRVLETSIHYILLIYFNFYYFLILFLETITKTPDVKRTAQTFIKAFRTGQFGRVFLDDDLIDTQF